MDTDTALGNESIRQKRSSDIAFPSSSVLMTTELTASVVVILRISFMRMDAALFAASAAFSVAVAAAVSAASLYVLAALALSPALPASVAALAAAVSAPAFAVSASVSLAAALVAAVAAVILSARLILTEEPVDFPEFLQDFGKGRMVGREESRKRQFVADQRTGQEILRRIRQLKTDNGR